MAHVAGHPLTTEHTSGERAGTDGPGRAVGLVVAVAGALALEVVALHDAGETLAPAGAGDVDATARGERLDRQFLADLEIVDRVETQFDEPLAGLRVTVKVAVWRLRR